MSFLKHVRTLVVPGVNTNVLRGWAKGRFLKGWRRFMRNPSSDNAQVLLRYGVTIAYAAVGCVLM